MKYEPWGSLGRCECGKLGYASRAIAKQNAARLHPGYRMRVYRCSDWAGLWHLTSQDAATVESWRDWHASRDAG